MRNGRTHNAVQNVRRHIMACEIVEEHTLACEMVAGYIISCDITRFIFMFLCLRLVLCLNNLSACFSVILFHVKEDLI